MPDHRKHRGPHPEDEKLFGPQAIHTMQRAAEHLAWLLTRGYAAKSSLKLVGDRFCLTERQRIAVLRSSCSDQSLESRRRTHITGDQLAGQNIDLDGFNVLTTIEAALAGGVILVGRDGCCRDMASMHGSYRKVAETAPAVLLIGQHLAGLHTAGCVWHLDRPVSNSGRLSQLIRRVAAEHNWAWKTELLPDADPVLKRSPNVVASADSAILDQCQRWTSLASQIVRQRIPDARLIQLGGARQQPTIDPCESR